MRRRFILFPLWSAVVACAPAPNVTVISTTRDPHGMPSTASPPDVCPAATELARSLRSDVQIDGYAPSGRPELEAFGREVRATLERLANASDGKLTFHIHDTTTDSSARANAEHAGLVERTSAHVRGHFGVVIRYGSTHVIIKELDPKRPSAVSSMITNKLREVHDAAAGTKHAIGVLTGHGETPLSAATLASDHASKSTVAAALTKFAQTYRLVDVDLRSGNQAVDPTLEGLFVFQPESDLSDVELRAIDRFAMQGKSVAIIASAVNVAKGDVQMVATLTSHRLDKLTSGYGIELGNDLVVDFGRPFAVPLVTERGTTKLIFPTLLDVLESEGRLDGQFAPLVSVIELYVPFASSLTLHREKQPGVDLRIVARTTTSSMREKADPNEIGPLRHWRPKGPFGEFAIAAAATGKLRSAFDPDVRAAKPARVLVLASSQLLENPLARATERPDLKRKRDSNERDLVEHLAPSYALRSTDALRFTVDLLAWMADDDGLAECSPPPQADAK